MRISDWSSDGCSSDLRLAPNDSWWADWFAAAGVATPLAPSRRGIELDSQLQEASAVQAGFGAAMMTPLFWQADLARGRMVPPFHTLHVEDLAMWQIGRASCRERVVQSVYNSWVAVSIKKKRDKK